MDYQIVRMKRKTMGIYILKDATVEVRCPIGIRLAEIEKFVLSKEKWILQKVSEKQIILEQRKTFALSGGSMLHLMGKEYPLQTVATHQAGFDGAHFYIPETCENKEYTIAKVYRKIAKSYLLPRVATFAAIMQCHPSCIKINAAKTRWGSCSGKNSINFSWKLMMADEKTIDYVIIHELAHIKEHNHSKRFWSIVEKEMPGYQLQQHSLKVLQERLLVEAWK